MNLLKVDYHEMDRGFFINYVFNYTCSQKCWLNSLSAVKSAYFMFTQSFSLIVLFFFYNSLYDYILMLKTKPRQIISQHFLLLVLAVESTFSQALKTLHLRGKYRTLNLCTKYNQSINAFIISIKLNYVIHPATQKYINNMYKIYINKLLLVVPFPHAT